MSVLDISAVAYHADLIADEPTLNATVAKLLISHSPLHAWTAHPKLNPDYERKQDEKFDIGTAWHALLLEGRNAVDIVEADDWRTNASKELRDQIRADGKIPLLAKQWGDICAMSDALHEQLERLDVHPPVFQAGAPEQTLVWDDDGVTCRARLDYLHADGSAVDDLKTTSRSANPETWSRSLFGMGYDVQAAFYLRGVKAVTGADAEFRLVVAETSAPYAVSVIGLTPAALALADDKVSYALDVWKRCLAKDEWPGYPTRVCYADLPSWEEVRWLDREAREQAA